MKSIDAWIVIVILLFVAIIVIVIVYYWKFVYQPNRLLQHAADNTKPIPGFPAKTTQS